MNDKVLQIENEFYGFIRPKRYNKYKNIRPNKILKEEGVQYLEIRVIDLNPFSPIGITYEQTKFLDILLLFCAFKESPLCSTREISVLKSNWAEVAKQGRNSDIILNKRKVEVSLKNWALEIYSELKEIAKFLDESQETEEHTQIINKFYDAIMDPFKTLSGKLVHELQKEKKSFIKFHLEKAKQFKEDYLKDRLSVYTLKFFEDAAKNSLEIQEKLDKEFGDFDKYLMDFLSN
jgi:glutamate--cysteine ligase